MTAVRPVARVLAACLALAVAACATTPPPAADPTPPARRTVDAKTQLERGY
jgi:type IV pilus biogenesis protein CpaD/CtpE